MFESVSTLLPRRELPVVTGILRFKCAFRHTVFENVPERPSKGTGAISSHQQRRRIVCDVQLFAYSPLSFVQSRKGMAQNS